MLDLLWHYVTGIGPTLRAQAMGQLNSRLKRRLSKESLKVVIDL